MRVSNIDTISALIDRIICERIKYFFFEKEKKDDLSQHQEQIILEIKDKLSQAFLECFSEEKYEYLGEKRTFTLNKLIDEIDNLTVNDIQIGEGDRNRLAEIQNEHPSIDVLIKNESLTRIANERRSVNKNKIDTYYAELW